MNYSDIKYYDVINGEGVRVSLFVSGCSHKCEHCFNKKTWNPKYGKLFSREVIHNIFEYIHEYEDIIQGISILGGDPTYESNIEPLSEFISEFKTNFPTKDVWIWSGYTYSDIQQDPKMLELISKCDVLVDGKFDESLKNLSLKYRGSSNQNVIELRSGKYLYIQ